MTNASAPPVRPQPPRYVKYAVVAIAVQIVLTLITAALLWGYTSQLSQLLIKSNKKLANTDKNKRNVENYLAGSSQVTKDLHDYRVSVTVHALLVCVLFAIAAYAIWRGLGLARWLYIVAAIFFSFSGILALQADGPGLTNGLSFVVALTSIGATVLLILPDSARYFAAVKALRAPPVAAGTNGGARPAGLRGLFGPPPPRQPRTGPMKPSGSANTRPALRPAGANAAVNAESGATNGRGKPKARVTAAATDAPDPDAVSTPRGRGKSRRVNQ